MLGPVGRRSALLGGLVVLGVGFELLNPQIVRAFIDTAQSGGSPQVLAAAAVLYIGVALVGQVVAVADTYLAESVGLASTNALRVDLTAHCRSLGLPFHTGLIATGDALYAEDEAGSVRWAARGVLAFEMEASVLFTIAALRGARAGCIVLASNNAGSREWLEGEALDRAEANLLLAALSAAVVLSG